MSPPGRQRCARGLAMHREHRLCGATGASAARRPLDGSHDQNRTGNPPPLERVTQQNQQIINDAKKWKLKC